MQRSTDKVVSLSRRADPGGMAQVVVSRVSVCIHKHIKSGY